MEIYNILSKHYLCRTACKILFYNFKKNGYLYVNMWVSVCVCVSVCVWKITPQTSNSEYLGVNCELVGDRGSRKPSMFGLHTLQCLDFHKYACINVII